MTIRPKKVDGDAPQDGRANDVSSAECGMIVADAHSADIQRTVTPDRRLRSWILLANALAWVAIVVLIRWLFF